jgi:hypothetical protein
MKENWYIAMALTQNGARIFPTQAINNAMEFILAENLVELEIDIVLKECSEYYEIPILDTNNEHIVTRSEYRLISSSSR